MPRWAGDRNPLETLSRSSLRTSCRRYYKFSISVALAATVEPLVGGIMLASGLTSFLVTRTQLRSQDGVRVGIARKKSHLDGSMTELLRGKPIVRTLNAVELEASRVRREATDLSEIERRHHRTMGLFDAGKMTMRKHIWGRCCPTRRLSCDTRFPPPRPC
jgi:hypothetical protein